mmetsp:Transcript_141408/g.451994  ORF Transcript_141408/g.451994 Transcript_141408/m.451994 type:complete len:270 (+) Transcript_141408:698-1507(+)
MLRITPSLRKVVNESTTTKTPTRETSSMPTLRNTCEMARKVCCILLTWLGFALRALMAASTSSRSMSRMGTRATSTAYIRNAMPALTSPFNAQAHVCWMVSKTDTWVCMRSGSPSESIMKDNSLREGCATYSKFMSKCSSMQGKVTPTHRSTAKLTAKTTTATCAMRPHRDVGMTDGMATAPVFSSGAAASWASSGKLGMRMPKEAIVEPTQKALKQVKPKPNCISESKDGGLLRFRNKHSIKMYTNMSGLAHFETTWTDTMHLRAHRI